MGWYIVITEEMRALGLSGNDLVVFATLHGYCQKGDGCYYGGQSALAERCGIALRTLRDIVRRLKHDDYLEEFQVVKGGKSLTAYSVKWPAEIAGGERQKLPVGAADSAGKKENENPFTNVKDTLSSSRTRGKKIPPTLEEVAAYCRERGSAVDPEAFVAFYTSNGWKVGKSPMKDWTAAIVTWERRIKNERSAGRRTTPAAPSKKGDYFVENLKALDRLQGTHRYEEYLAAKGGAVVDEQ